MNIIKLTVLAGYPKTLPIPPRHHIKIYKTTQRFFFEILPKELDAPKVICPKDMNLFIDNKFIPEHKDCWIKLINEDEVPLEILLEFYFP